MVAILGILAAVVIPLYQDNTQKAKESAAKENLRLLRNAIDRYEVKNGIPPGYPDNKPPMAHSLVLVAQIGGGNYLKDIPYNPFNNNKGIKVISDYEDFPSEATSTYGWIYKPKTKIIKIDYTGKDSEGILYFDY